MVEGITDREALYLGDLLGQEVVAVDKFSMFANDCNDPELKSVCRELVNVHIRHFERLLQQVNVSSIGAGSNIGSSTRFAPTGTYSQTYTPGQYTQGYTPSLYTQQGTGTSIGSNFGGVSYGTGAGTGYESGSSTAYGSVTQGTSYGYGDNNFGYTDNNYGTRRS